MTDGVGEGPGPDQEADGHAAGQRAGLEAGAEVGQGAGRRRVGQKHTQGQGHQNRNKKEMTETLKRSFL